MKKHYDVKRKFNIVLADDDDDDRYMFNEALEELRLDVATQMVISGQELMEHLEKTLLLPDIIFLDINMPVMDGFQCLKELKKDDRYKDICVVIYSTSSMKKDMTRTFSLGANIYLVKPNNFNELKDLLYKAIVFHSYYQLPHIDREKFVMSLGT
jgi:CheY-like chemotaxis protein